MRSLVLFVALLAIACSNATPMRPSPPPVVPTIASTIQYTINIPDAALTQTLRNQYPNGISIAPYNAQRQYDYTQAYGGAANVYFGSTAPPDGMYNTGIVVAPLAAATKLMFTATDWPNICPSTCTWLGWFEYTLSLKKEK